MRDINNYIVEKLHLNGDNKDLKSCDLTIKDIQDKDTALDYIKANFKTEEVESDYTDKYKAVKIIYNDKLSMVISFINKYEFLFTIYGPDETVIYDMNSTREADSCDWDKLINIRNFAAHLKGLRANFGRNKARIDYCHRVADKIYALL